MKTTVLGGILAIFCMMGISCKKELSRETHISTGSLKTEVTGNCLSSVIIGNYSKDSALTSANYIDVTVNVITGGTYSIVSDTVNGFYFRGDGFVDSSGLHTVRMFGKGKPLTEGIYQFSNNYGSSNCTVGIMVSGTTDNASYAIDCNGAMFAGSYSESVAMTSSNTATISATVTKPGKYTISTPVVNGVSFSTSGTFTSATTPQSIILVASGTPATKGPFSYTVAGSAATCSFPVTFTAAPTPGAFTLGGSPNACTTPVINGTYTPGVALSASNTVVIGVNVIATGAYLLSTNMVNGMTFAASGTFTAAGPQNITLSGTGTPTSGGVSNFTPQIGTSSCTFGVSVASSPVNAGTFTAKIDGIFTAFNDRSGFTHEDNFGVMVLNIGGYKDPGNGSPVSAFQFFIENNDGSALKAGTYNEKGMLSLTGYRIEVDYDAVNADNSVTIWNTSSTLLPPPNPAFTIVVSSLTATRVKGTFSGKVANIYEGSTQTKTITEGVFDLPVK